MSRSASNGLSKTKTVVDLTAAPLDTQIYDQLGELARFIDTTLKTLTEFRDPVSATTEQLPQAVTHLQDLKRLTEEGSLTVMQLVESLQENRRRILSQLAGLEDSVGATPDLPSLRRTLAGVTEIVVHDQKALIDIMTAMSFQDLVAQRVNKLVTIVSEVEHRLLELVVVFGPYTKGAGAAQSTKASAMLQQLEASKTTAMNQDLADEILKQFGFN
jgi:chemotaxis protein CheZ